MPQHIVGVAPGLLVGRNASRLTITFRNQSLAGQTLYIDNVRPEGLTVENAGYVLGVGDVIFVVKMFDGPDVILPWSAISDAANGVMYSKETAEGVK